MTLPSARAVGALCFAATLAYVAVGALTLLVWYPLSAGVGATLGEVNATLAAADDALPVWMVVVWGGAGVAAAGGVAVLGFARPRADPTMTLALALLVLAAALPGFLFSSFAVGFSVSDAAGVAGPEASTGGTPDPTASVTLALSGVSTVALAGVLAIAAAAGWRSRGRRAVPAAL